MAFDSNHANFFLVVPPPFEKLAKRELLVKCGERFSLKEERLVIRKGGVELQLPLGEGLALNHYLKIPNRVLLRLEEFRCRDTPKLFKKIKNFDWSGFLGGQIPNIKVSARNSRLFDSRKIEKAVRDGLIAYYRARPPKKKYLESLAKLTLPEIYVDIFEDQCTLGIDTSGERLGKRKQKLYSVKAPLRENLAAALFYWGKSKVRPVELLFDPMCGSGTMLLEAATFEWLNHRDEYAYQLFPLAEVFSGSMPVNSAPQLWGNDKDIKATKALEENLKNYDLDLKITNQDFFELSQNYFDRSFGVISNLPYNKRIKVADDFYSRLTKKLQELEAAWVLLVCTVETKLVMGSHYQKIGELAFSNGGLKVKAVLWQAN